MLGDKTAPLHQQSGGERNVPARTLVNAGKAGYDVAEKKKADQKPHPAENARVDHGLNEMAANLVDAAAIFDVAGQRVVQAGGAFGGAHQAAIQRREDIGLVCQRACETLPLVKSTAQGIEYRCAGRTTLPFLQRIERFGQGQPGFQQGEQFLAEKEQVEGCLPLGAKFGDPGLPGVFFRNLDRQRAQVAARHLAGGFFLAGGIDAQRFHTARANGSDREIHRCSVTDVGVLAGSARPPVMAVGKEFEVAPAAAGEAIEIGIAPGVNRNILLQIRTVPARLVVGTIAQGIQPGLRGGIVPVIEAVRFERPGKRLDLRAGGGHFGFAELRHIARTDVGCQQADDGDHDQQFEQSESG